MNATCFSSELPFANRLPASVSKDTYANALKLAEAHVVESAEGQRRGSTLVIGDATMVIEYVTVSPTNAFRRAGEDHCVSVNTPHGRDTAKKCMNNDGMLIINAEDGLVCAEGALAKGLSKDVAGGARQRSAKWIAANCSECLVVEISEDACDVIPVYMGCEQQAYRLSPSTCTWQRRSQEGGLTHIWNRSQQQWGKLHTLVATVLGVEEELTFEARCFHTWHLMAMTSLADMSLEKHVQKQQSQWIGKGQARLQSELNRSSAPANLLLQDVSGKVEGLKRKSFMAWRNYATLENCRNEDVEKEHQQQGTEIARTLRKIEVSHEELLDKVLNVAEELLENCRLEARCFHTWRLVTKMSFAQKILEEDMDMKLSKLYKVENGRLEARCFHTWHLVTMMSFADKFFEEDMRIKDMEIMLLKGSNIESGRLKARCFHSWHLVSMMSFADKLVDEGMDMKLSAFSKAEKCRLEARCFHSWHLMTMMTFAEKFLEEDVNIKLSNLSKIENRRLEARCFHRWHLVAMMSFADKLLVEDVNIKFENCLLEGRCFHTWHLATMMSFADLFFDEDLQRQQSQLMDNAQAHLQSELNLYAARACTYKAKVQMQQMALLDVWAHSETECLNRASFTAWRNYSTMSNGLRAIYNIAEEQRRQHESEIERTFMKAEACRVDSQRTMDFLVTRREMETNSCVFASVLRVWKEYRAAQAAKANLRVAVETQTKTRVLVSVLRVWREYRIAQVGKSNLRIAVDTQSKHYVSASVLRVWREYHTAQVAKSNLRVVVEAQIVRWEDHNAEGIMRLCLAYWIAEAVRGSHAHDQLSMQNEIDCLNKRLIEMCKQQITVSNLHYLALGKLHGHAKAQVQKVVGRWDLVSKSAAKAIWFQAWSKLIQHVNQLSRDTQAMQIWLTRFLLDAVRGMQRELIWNWIFWTKSEKQAQLEESQRAEQQKKWEYLMSEMQAEHDLALACASNDAAGLQTMTRQVINSMFRKLMREIEKGLLAAVVRCWRDAYEEYCKRQVKHHISEAKKRALRSSLLMFLEADRRSLKFITFYKWRHCHLMSCAQIQRSCVKDAYIDWLQNEIEKMIAAHRDNMCKVCEMLSSLKSSARMGKCFTIWKDASKIVKFDAEAQKAKESTFQELQWQQLAVDSTTRVRTTTVLQAYDKKGENILAMLVFKIWACVVAKRLDDQHWTLNQGETLLKYSEFMIHKHLAKHKKLVLVACFHRLCQECKFCGHQMQVENLEDALEQAHRDIRKNLAKHKLLLLTACFHRLYQECKLSGHEAQVQNLQQALEKAHGDKRNLDEVATQHQASVVFYLAQIDELTETLHKELQTKKELANELRDAYAAFRKSRQLTPSTSGAPSHRSLSLSSVEQTSDMIATTSATLTFGISSSGRQPLLTPEYNLDSLPPQIFKWQRISSAQPSGRAWEEAD